MQKTAQLRLQATKLVGERVALAQTGNFAELLRRDEMEANELKSRRAKPGKAEGACDEDEGAHEAEAAVSMVQKESLTRAMTRLTLSGIAGLGPEETKKYARSWRKKTPPPLPPGESGEREAARRGGLMHSEKCTNTANRCTQQWRRLGGSLT